MKPRQWTALILTLISFGFLIPGVTLSMLSVNSQGAVEAPFTKISLQFFDTTNSILQTIGQLFGQGYPFVAAMIMLFSIVLPILKSAAIAYAAMHKNEHVKRQILKLTRTLAKWSMCDVFIVAIFLAYLSTGSSNQGQVQELAILGIPLNVDVLINMTAHLEKGFYCFVTYCLLALVAQQLMDNYS